MDVVHITAGILIGLWFIPWFWRRFVLLVWMRELERKRLIVSTRSRRNRR